MTSRTPKLEEFAFSERERELLQAARQERMPLQLSQSVWAALEQQLPAAPASVSGKGAMHALRLKVSLWGTLGAVVIGSLTQVDWRSAPAPRAEVDKAVVSASGAAVSPPSPTAAQLDQPPSAAANERAPAPDQLRLELALLEGARTALGRGAVPEAAAQLDRYAERFEHGTLRPESEALRIELDMRRGQSQSARRQAARFLAAYPEHPLRDRVKQLTRGVR